MGQPGPPDIKEAKMCWAGCLFRGSLFVGFTAGTFSVDIDKAGAEMQYMLLLYSSDEGRPEPGSPEMMAEMQEWFAYTDAMAEAGQLVGGEPLQGVETAKTLQIRDGNTSITDGPFAETKEVLGGYYLVEVPDEATALDWASKCPLARYGSVEVRPLMVLPPAPG